MIKCVSNLLSALLLHVEDKSIEMKTPIIQLENLFKNVCDLHFIDHYIIRLTATKVDSAYLGAY